MSWLETLIDPKPVTAVFSSAPSLSCIRVHELGLQQDGPTCTCRFDTKSYPEKPPKKWLDNESNCVQLIVNFTGVRDVSIESWGLDNVGDLKLIKESGGVKVSFQSKAGRFSFLADYASVQRVTAYCDTSAWAADKQ